MSSDEPLVTVVMCAYNTRRYVEAAVASVLNQNYQNVELIISDDRSTDGTREWLVENVSKDPRVRMFLQHENVGYVANKNFAISQARGTYVTQCDSDDCIDPDLVAKQIGVTERLSQIKIVACGYHWMDEQGRIIRTVGPAEDTIIYRYDGEAYPFWFPPLLVHRNVYADIGQFTDIFSGIGDDLYWTVRANERYPIYCVRDPLYFFRQTPNSLTKQLNDNRKLISSSLLAELLRQRLETGTDWLGGNNLTAIRQYEESLLRNRSFMAEQYRIWAAKTIDVGQWEAVCPMLRRSLLLNPMSVKLLRTFLYYLRSKLVRTPKS